MITKTKRIEKRFLYREILNKISTNTNGMVIQGMLIDDGVITYELVDEYEKRFDYAKKNTSLPESPDYKAINEFKMYVNERIVRGEI